ncbi:hypothetical protein NHX12_003096 [Muraenolepis orangiensis]|uniref:Uncharacterized protein n=1 Tax=Muraenolepis orangiensis TaxID=630683 RepID=A0A9Q0DXT9_9TELE|nr:hypothetical protein NHX12_003096 [Muraenolepis orangiensis]
MGALPVALIVMSIILVVLTSAAASWYCRLSRLPRSRPPPPSDELETEMWKPADSDTDPHGTLTDKTDGKTASEVTLCINSDAKASAVV